MKPGDLVCMRHTENKYYLIKGWNIDVNSKRKYYILIDTKTGDIITAYDYKMKLVHAS